MAVVHILKSGSSKSPHLMELVRSLLYLAATYGFEFQVHYINTKVNTVADALSRLDFHRFWKLAPNADIIMTQPAALPIGYNTPGQ